MSLQGKVAIVTGGGKGIGRAICIKLASDGAAVSVWDRNEAVANDTVNDIIAAGGRAIACIGDAAIANSIASFVARTRAELGPITILVNNAGMASFSAFQQITEDAWDHMMMVNLKGPFLCIKAILPDMLSVGWGRIINISSSSAQTGAPLMAHYVTSKGGLIGFTKALAAEYAGSGITVNNVPPGFVDTPMLRRTAPYGGEIEVMASHFPMKRPGKPEEVAAACSYLASEGASYVTGHTLSVNGGRYMA